MINLKLDTCLQKRRKKGKEMKNWHMKYMEEY